MKPDIASVAGSDGAVTDPAFLHYPSDQITTVSGTPGKGGSYSAVTPLWGTVPTPGNSFYRAMNKALGVELTVRPADGNHYDTIVPTMTAARRLPDWIQLPSWWSSNFNVGELAGTQLTDLTPYLSGDRIKKYPNLAALPTGAWQAGTWGDKLYGIPCSASRFVVAGDRVLPAGHPGAEGHHGRPGHLRGRPDEAGQGTDRRQARRVGLRRRVDVPLPLLGRALAVEPPRRQAGPQVRDAAVP
ncbi:hypothetical protein ACQ4WX_49355 [Streptomyces lasalocidi]